MRKLALAVVWIIPIISVGITAMNDDVGSHMWEVSLLECSNHIAELDATMFSTVVDSSFEVVSANTGGAGSLGPSQPLPKMRVHTRTVRPTCGAD